MKRLFTTVLLFALPATALAQAVPVASPLVSPIASPTPAPVVVMVPGGTSVIVNFPSQLSSDSATEGAEVPIVAAEELDIDGYRVIQKGAQGEATLTKVLHSGGNGSGGQIQFNVDWIYSVDGGKIALSPVNDTTPNADRKGEASTLAIAGWATFGLLGLFTHNIAHGNAAVITPEKLFTVFVDHDVHVTAIEKISAPGYDN